MEDWFCFAIEVEVVLRAELLAWVITIEVVIDSFLVDVREA